MPDHSFGQIRGHAAFSTSSLACTLLSWAYPAQARGVVDAAQNLHHKPLEPLVLGRRKRKGREKERWWVVD